MCASPAEGAFSLAFGRRGEVPGAFSGSLRNAELCPDNWALRGVLPEDREGLWREAMDVLSAYREALRAAPEEGPAELDRPETVAGSFLMARFEFLGACVVSRLVREQAFERLPRAREFIAFAWAAGDMAEEVERRLIKDYSDYNPAAWSMLEAELDEPLECPECAGEATNLVGCTRCGWGGCGRCAAAHQHPELRVAVPFFRSRDGEPGAPRGERRRRR